MSACCNVGHWFHGVGVAQSTVDVDRHASARTRLEALIWGFLAACEDFGHVKKEKAQRYLAVGLDGPGTRGNVTRGAGGFPVDVEERWMMRIQIRVSVVVGLSH